MTDPATDLKLFDLTETRGRQSKEQDPDITIKDCIPMFHLNLTLLPMLEIALSQIEAFCQEENLAICGYYHIHSNISDNKPDTFVQKLMDRLSENCGKVFLCMVDNCKINSKDKDCPYTVYECREGKLSQSNSLPLEAGAMEAAARCIQNGDFQHLADFDNHLDNVALDWRNKDLVDL